MDSGEVHVHSLTFFSLPVCSHTFFSLTFFVEYSLICWMREGASGENAFPYGTRDAVINRKKELRKIDWYVHFIFGGV
jgi:hypothetical protein